jgi:hypothetical protein
MFRNLWTQTTLDKQTWIVNYPHHFSCRHEKRLVIPDSGGSETDVQGPAEAAVFVP